MKKLFKGRWIKDHQRQLPYIIIGVIIISFYAAGLIGQASSAGFISGQATFYVDPVRCILASFQHPVGIVCVLILYACISGYLYLKYRDMVMLDTTDDERGFKMENSGVYGTSSLMDPEQVKNFAEVEPLSRTTGMIVGKYPKAGKNGEDLIVSMPLDGCRYKYDAFGRLAMKIGKAGVPEPVRERLKIFTNRHMMIIGSTGSGKSYCFARPAIFQSVLQGESYVVTDPKGELYADTSEYARDHGYVVKILNLTHPEWSDSWDVLESVNTSPQVGIEAQNLANIIITNTTTPGSKADEVYSSGEKNLLTALILFVLDPPIPLPNKTLGMVYEVLCKEEEELMAMFEMLREDHPARRPWSIFKTASPNMRGNLKQGLGVRIQVLQEDVIKKVTGVPDIKTTDPGIKKCAYYVIMSDMNDTLKFISSLFFSCLINDLVNYSRTTKAQRLKYPVNLIMDEFIAIGKIPAFDKKLATVRSAGINICMIFQTLSQLQNEYPDGVWETMISCCHTFMCIACNDLTTAEYLSKRSGTMTVALENLRVDRPSLELGNVPTTISHSHSVGERPVLQPAEAMKYAQEGKVIIAVTGADMFVCDKFPYTQMVNPDELRIVNMSEHTPAWVLQTQYTPEETGTKNPSILVGDYVSKSKRKSQQTISDKTEENDKDGLPSSPDDSTENKNASDNDDDFDTDEEEREQEIKETTAKKKYPIGNITSAESRDLLSNF